MPVSFVNGALPAVDFETITVSTVAIGCTAAKILVQSVPGGSSSEGASYVDTKRADEALFTVETAAIRFRLDGTNPTAAVGHLLNVGDSLIISGYSNLSRLRFIRVSADASVSVTYYRKS